ncbi:hypothetical protein V1502_12240 [Bacillus sp. SCS-153A]|uniref:hypothetical protein n=1 Tax=Rossellomorea sedimentorum TaxID=3115294 RepID=UPI003906B21E
MKNRRCQSGGMRAWNWGFEESTVSKWWYEGVELGVLKNRRCQSGGMRAWNWGFKESTVSKWWYEGVEIRIWRIGVVKAVV